MYFKMNLQKNPALYQSGIKLSQDYLAHFQFLLNICNVPFKFLVRVYQIIHRLTCIDHSRMIPSAEERPY